MRIVVDTNILVSAFVFKGSVRQPLLKLLHKPDIHFFLSNQSKAELLETLFRPKFLNIVDKASLHSDLSAYLEVCDEIQISHTFSVCRDPKDNQFLDLAASAKADAIITGDQDLLVLHPFQGIDILTLANFSSKFLVH